MSDSIVKWMSYAGPKFAGMTLAEWTDAFVERFGCEVSSPSIVNQLEMMLRDAGWTPKETPKGLRYWVRSEDSP